MKIPKLVLFCCAVVNAQTVFFPNPARVVGQQSVTLRSASPNLVEGRELFSPSGIALDTSVSPPILYVADTFNNRVLGWKNAAAFANGAYADVVIGQRDLLSTSALGPQTTLTQGLTWPTGVAVDGQGNLYVVDTGNNRILRYPKPFDATAQPDTVKVADRVIGQKDFNSETANPGGISESTVSLVATVSGRPAPLPTALAFWSDAAGNVYLYFTDSGNHRVLRYPMSSIQQGNGARADMALGQGNLSSAVAAPATAQGALSKNGLRYPHGLAVDATGRVYVSDDLGRVLVFPAGAVTGTSAVRIMGITLVQSGQQSTINETTLSLGYPLGLLMVGNNPAVVDPGYNRILIYDPFDLWPAETSTVISPAAKQVIGQPDFASTKDKAGDAGLRGPVAAAFAANELYVADSQNNRVIVLPQPYQHATRLLGQLGFDYSGANLVEGREMYFAGGLGGIAVDTASDPPHLYIADPGNNRVLGFRDVRKCRPGDKADLVIGQPSMLYTTRNYTVDGNNPVTDNNLSGPAAVAVDANGNLYVADAGNARVLRFNRPFDSPTAMPRANLVLGQRDFYTKNTDPSERSMGLPAGLTFTPDGNLLVSDAAMNRVLLFRKDSGDFTNGMRASSVFGQPDFVSTSTGNDLNRMSHPLQIATDTSARLYVADYSNSRVLVFSDVGSAPSSDTRAVLALTAGFRSPQAVVVSPVTGELWVGETGINRVSVFPEFSTLLTSQSATSVLATGTTTIGSVPLGLALDGSGNLLVAESGNRISLYFPPLWANNGANFLPSPSIQASLGRACCTPGMIATLWPQSKSGVFGAIDVAGASALPLPTVLSDAQVLVSGANMQETASPLFYVSSNQINFQFPTTAPTNGTLDVRVVRNSTGEVLATGQATMAPASPGLFTNSFSTGLSGAVQVAVLNQDNSCNGLDGTKADPAFCPNGVRPARNGEVIQIFATGQGPVNNGPGDGLAGNGQTTDQNPRVLIGTEFVDPDFSGLAPSLVGVWQINVRISDKVAPGAQPLLLLYKDISSSAATKPAWPFTVIQVKAR